MSRIYIDVGHGTTGEDTGATGTLNGVLYQENECNLKIALAAYEALTAAGHTVTLSRTENRNITEKIGSYGQADSNLIASANRVNAGAYDLMVSIHNNSAGNASARRHQLFYKISNGREAESKKLAESISGCLAGVIPCNYVAGSDYYGILRLHDKIGVLCECAFMSNAEDLAVLASGTAEIGAAIARGINTYLDAAPAGNRPHGSGIYRVRKTWADAGSQLGAYSILQNAINLADRNPGYSVFDENGTAVYPVPAPGAAEPEAPTEPDYKALCEELRAKIEKALLILG